MEDGEEDGPAGVIIDGGWVNRGAGQRASESSKEREVKEARASSLVERKVPSGYRCWPRRKDRAEEGDSAEDGGWKGEEEGGAVK